ncbi:MAG: hypothetical protein LC794_01875 [Acidobacteria bacterium]|nr:hypothetical protein [Acidobacteriota bacterium]
MNELFKWPDTEPKESFQQMLLFAGLLPPSIARRETLPEAPELGQVFVDYWRRLRGRAWPWRLRESTAGLMRSSDDVTRLIAAGTELLKAANDDVRNRGLRVEINAPGQYDPLALYKALLTAGAHSAFLRQKNEGEMAWSWPLRIGLDNDSSLLSGVTPDRSIRPLFEMFNYDRAPLRMHLLLSSASLSRFKEAMAQSRRRSQTDSIILLGGFDDPDPSLEQQLLAVSKSTGAQGVFIFDSLDLDHAETLSELLIDNLSHDLPLDSAVAALARQFDARVLSWATRSLVEASSVREQGRIIARRLQEMGDKSFSIPVDPFRTEPEAAAQDPPETSGGGSFDTPRSASTKRVIAKELGTTIARSLEVGEAPAGAPPQLTFDSESQGARRVAAFKKATSAQTDLDAARREDRHLQVRVETPSGRGITKEARMLPSREYVASVFIGAINPEYLSVDQPLKSPVPDGPVVLDVLFWEPQASPKPQIAQLTLPAHGDTGVANFRFKTKEDQSTFSARIAIYHRNRNLQTGLLKGFVGNQPAALSFTLDATPLTKFVGLRGRVGVDASIIVNDDASGIMHAFVKTDDKVATAPVSENKPSLATDVDPSRYESLEAIKDTLGRAITRITTNPEEYSDLAKEGTRKLLLDLAQHGSALLTRLRKHSEMRNLFDDVKYIQIVMAHVDAFFPIEYFYDGETPEDNARVCDGPQSATAALLSGKCCGAYEQNPDLVICPLRFWSLSKVIERHAHLPEHTRLDGKFQLRSYPVSARNRLVDPLRCAVLAASENVDLAEKDTVKTLCTDMDKVLRTNVVPSTNWNSWIKNVADTRPNLLVLLPHHEQGGGFDLLEVGGDKLKSTLIKNKHVRSPQDTEGRPIVLLIGCETDSAKLDLESSVTAFQDAGAVIIVSTIATILGRHAGPAAAAIVEELKNHEGNVDATFGDVMLKVRQRLLAKGIPMVLGLTSYGDADYRIGA